MCMCCMLPWCLCHFHPSLVVYLSAGLWLSALAARAGARRAGRELGFWASRPSRRYSGKAPGRRKPTGKYKSINDPIVTQRLKVKISAFLNLLLLGGLANKQLQSVQLHIM